MQLPQAFRIMLPALISQLVVVLKDTSLAAVLGLYIELLRRGNIIALNLDNPIQTLFVVGLIFILINYALSRIAVTVEGRLAQRRTRGAAATERRYWSERGSLSPLSSSSRNPEPDDALDHDRAVVAHAPDPHGQAPDPAERRRSTARDRSRRCR